MKKSLVREERVSRFQHQQIIEFQEIQRNLAIKIRDNKSVKQSEYETNDNLFKQN